MENKDINKSASIFFCDIHGTIDDNFTDEDCFILASLLEQLKDNNNDDYLFFKILSSENQEVINYYEQSLSKYFSDNIILLDNNYSDNHLLDAKISWAILDIQKIRKKYNLDKVYFADDMFILHEILASLLKEIINTDLNSIVPGKEENKLSFINEEIRNKFINGKKIIK